ncbi:hypothetical protein ACTI_79010 [Actinoplanes sp. OR16]|uniref:DUF397 domain-containing protein n=1 Tax=Actinoplanes sp. OR16 TaxID=946334 RepID=UPI000F6C879A|nr:DUF397 domain-containing protein [Actinoplanes sp. OR16]BBH71216.1 hypothetical protein ACTI_79010 [Actinoplanes sp. OR16]
MTASRNDRILDWQRSSYCADNACVEVAVDDDGDRYLRNSEQPAGPYLRFSAGGWEAFVADLEAGWFAP